MNKKPNPAKQAEAKARRDALRRRLANLDAQERQAYTSRGIIAKIEGGHCSINNTMLIYLQCNGATPSVVGGYRQWQKAGRQVQAGQHGYLIYYPTGGERDPETNEITHPEAFYMGTVFDISQTEPIGQPAPAPTYAPDGRPAYRAEPAPTMAAPEPSPADDIMKGFEII